MKTTKQQPRDASHGDYWQIYAPATKDSNALVVEGETRVEVLNGYFEHKEESDNE